MEGKFWGRRGMEERGETERRGKRGMESAPSGGVISGGNNRGFLRGKIFSSF